MFSTELMDDSVGERAGKEAFVFNEASTFPNAEESTDEKLVSISNKLYSYVTMMPPSIWEHDWQFYLSVYLSIYLSIDEMPVPKNNP